MPEKLIRIESEKLSRIKLEMGSSTKIPIPMTEIASDKWRVPRKAFDMDMVLASIVMFLEVMES